MRTTRRPAIAFFLAAALLLANLLVVTHDHETDSGLALDACAACLVGHALQGAVSAGVLHHSEPGSGDLPATHRTARFTRPFDLTYLARAPPG